MPIDHETCKRNAIVYTCPDERCRQLFVQEPNESPEDLLMRFQQHADLPFFERFEPGLVFRDARSYSIVLPQELLDDPDETINHTYSQELERVETFSQSPHFDFHAYLSDSRAIAIGLVRDKRDILTPDEFREFREQHKKFSESAYGFRSKGLDLVRTTPQVEEILKIRVSNLRTQQA